MIYFAYLSYTAGSTGSLGSTGSTASIPSDIIIIAWDRYDVGPCASKLASQGLISFQYRREET